MNARTDITPYFADDATFSIVGGPSARGRDAAVETIRGIHYVSFDSHVRIERTFHGDGHAAAELVFVGTHVGDFAGLAPTGRAVEVPYCVVYDFTEEGRISALRAYFPLHVLMAQLSGEA